MSDIEKVKVGGLWAEAGLGKNARLQLKKQTKKAKGLGEGKGFLKWNSTLSSKNIIWKIE